MLYYKIMWNLNKGKRYGKYIPNRVEGRAPIFWEVLSSDTNYIYWNNFGSSANKNNMHYLRWILKTIFQMTAREFTRAYVIK